MVTRESASTITVPQDEEERTPTIIDHLLPEALPPVLPPAVADQREVESVQPSALVIVALDC